MAAMECARFIPYSVSKYDFAAVGRAIFKVDDLTKLHIYIAKTRTAKGLRPDLSYEDNLALRRVFHSLPKSSNFYQVYRAFVAEVIAPIYGGSISYTMHPTFRVHLAGTPSVSKWHADVQVTKRTDQITAWIPFMDVHGGCTLWTESHYGLCDFTPVDVAYGEALFFDGGYLAHGTVSNDTEITRVSIDLRFSPKRPELIPPSYAILAARPPGMLPPEPVKESGQERGVEAHLSGS